MPSTPPPPSNVSVAPVDAGPVAPAPSSSSSSSSDTGEAPASPTPRSEWKDGARVVVRGRISKGHFQHMGLSIEGKKEHDFEIEDGGLTVVHAASLPTCDGVLELRGRVVEVHGPSKRPGRGPTKVDETYTEMHVDVDAARCVKP